MKFQLRGLTAAAVAAAALGAPSARALVSLEDGKDHIFVDGTIEMGYDSNVFANSQNEGSVVYQGSLGTEFARRAGWIGVNVNASLSFASYARYSAQNYVDPRLTAEFTKQTGRTTGSLTVSLAKENRADVDVNTRDVSWNYEVGLNFQYPVIERYSFTGSLDFDHVNYQDQQLFTNMTTYTGNLYLYYILNEQRDLFIDYRARLTDEATGEYDVDNGISLGVSGRVFGPFNGSLQAGYQRRTTYDSVDAGSFDDVTAGGTMTWNINRRMTLTGNLSRDYSTTANTLSVDESNAGLTFQDSLTSKASATLQAMGGENKFIGNEGLTGTDLTRRIDYFISLNAAYFYTINQHLKLSVNYTYYKNWSTLAYAVFPRSQVNFSISSHW